MAITGTDALGGRYALLEVLGTGGMATVYRAVDQVLGRDVAVKVLSPQYAADPGFLARFEREARHVAALSHPRIVTVFDCGVDGTTPYIVMELVAGRTLRRTLDEAGPLTPGEAVRIAAAVCEALQAAHAAGLVHRDINPANIVLSAGQVKVLDFGIARAEDPAGGTRTRAVLGTAAYLSPEQASGRPADSQADLYALGCVLFEMLTGTPPFTADSAVGVAYRHVHDDPGPPSALRPGLPARLDQITGQLLAKDPAARPPGAAAAKDRLLAAVQPADRTAVLDFQPRGPANQRPRPANRRRPTRVEVALAIALAALSVVLLTRPARTAAPLTGAARTTAPPGSPAASHPAGHVSQAPHRTHSARTAGPLLSALPPAAAAAAAFVGDLQAGVADGQVTPQAGQEMLSHLQQLLFRPAGDPHQTVQQYAQLVQSYDKHWQQGQVTGAAAAALRRALQALGATLGAQ